ncbi:S-layer homology domain-containing protein [Cohnella boryungensis]|uniref:S-layer homology domain-containing protein n=1 Tax=Cohnella boryungensis TaxID=768479 RepID=A0ABV8SFH6_9BACL
MRKKIVGLLMAVLLCFHFSVSFAAGAAKTSADFKDLKDLDAATKAKFDALISAGVFEGVGGDRFGIGDEMNRAQFAKVAAKIFDLNVEKNSTTSSFNDVSTDNWALGYIEAVAKAGITDGVGNGNFNPAGDVTKEQLATFFVRGLGMGGAGKATPGVNDSTVSDWAKGYVALALQLKLLDNGADGKFGGQTNATRDLLVLGAYEAKGQYEDQIEQKRKEEEEKKKEEELKKAEEEKKKQEEEKKKQQGQSGSSSPQPVQATVETPTALPAGGAVTSGTQVTLTSATASAAVYYTTDLSEPTTSSTPYTGPIILTGSTTIKAIAVKPGSKNSSVARFEYTVAMPIVLPDTISPLTEDQPYTGSVAKLSGGTGVVTYAVTNGVLPAGLTLDPSTGAITGTPSESGAYQFTIGATDSATPPATATMPYTGNITPSLSRTSLDLINQASASGDWDEVTVTTFADAGITGVTSEYLYGIQGILQDYDYPSRAQPKTKSQIQTIVTETIYLTAINNYFAYGYGTEPDKASFDLAGLVGVTDLNLAGINMYLQSQYGGFGGGGMGGGIGGSLSAGSTKQQIQAAIDDYLNSL